MREGGELVGDLGSLVQFDVSLEKMVTLLSLAISLYSEPFFIHQREHELNLSLGFSGNSNPDDSSSRTER